MNEGLALVWEPYDGPMTQGELAATNALAMADLGADEVWSGRREAYRNAITPGERDAVRRWFGPERIGATIKGKWLLSSCGLVRRAVEASIGVASDGHFPPYRDGSAMAVCMNLAIAHGAWAHDATDIFIGDALWRADRQHVATVVELHGHGRIVTVEGGQAGGLGEGTEIRRREREVRVLRGVHVVCDAGAPDGAGWPLRGVTRVALLPAGRPRLVARRVDPMAGATEPCPPTVPDGEPTA